jgi:uroporphyrin-III C-methyltransferase
MTTHSAGKVHLVGAGPGDPALLTVKAAELLRHAEIVLHDDLVPASILALAGPQALLVNVGKRCGAKKITQLEINNLMIASARRGLHVVRLKSGDPAIFGRLAEEIDALEAAGILFEVVPGVTAGVAAAASLGASLTDRRTTSRILIVSGHHATQDGATISDESTERFDWPRLLAAGTTIVIYMPGHECAALRRELLEAGVHPETPAVVVSRATTSAQRHYATTLAALHSLPALEPPTILLVGRSLQRALRSAAVAASSAGATSHLDLNSLGNLAEFETAQNS